MKKTFALLFPVVIALFSCGRGTVKQIENAAYQYSYAMANYDVDGAEPFATEETKQTTLVTGRAMMQLVDSNYIKSDIPAKIEIVKTEMVSDTVAVVTYHKTTPIKDFVSTVEVHKCGKQWLVHSPTKVVQQELPKELLQKLDTTSTNE